LEDPDLVDMFGDDYRRYQRQVSMLIHGASPPDRSSFTQPKVVHSTWEAAFERAAIGGQQSKALCCVAN
jgi:hypothetical protein